MIQRVMQDINHLLPLLTVSVASTEKASAVADQQGRVLSCPGASDNAVGHLRHFYEAMQTIRSEQSTAYEVQKCMKTLRNSLLQLKGDDYQKVLEALGYVDDLHWSGMRNVKAELSALRGCMISYAEEAMASHVQREVLAEVKEIKENFAKVCGLEASVVESLNPDKIIQVCSCYFFHCQV